MERRERVSNDNIDLTPVTEFDGPALEFDFPAVEIGVAEYPEGPTGCTVFHFPKGVTAVADCRGGARGSRYMDDLVPGPGFLHAICLTGGSLYGLEAAAGVGAELLARAGYSTDWDKIAAVTGAVVFDYGPRDNAIYPDKELGRAALRGARTGVFPLGARGAGASVTVGNYMPGCQPESSGQGGAFREIGATKIAVFSVVNAVGAIIDRDGQVVRGHLETKSGRRRRMGEGPPPSISAPRNPRAGNTTLTVVATNQRMDAHPLRQLARQTHGSMARAIEPFHTLTDGDTLYAATTGEVTNADVSDSMLAAIASELAWDAVLASIPAEEDSGPR